MDLSSWCGVGSEIVSFSFCTEWKNGLLLEIETILEIGLNFGHKLKAVFLKIFTKYQNFFPGHTDLILNIQKY